MNVVEFPESRSGGGFYSTTEAARYLKMASALSIRNWVFGTERTAAVIRRQYSESRTELGFYDLLEVRFIDYFRRNNVSLQSIRQVASAARKELRQTHPFATSPNKFVTDRKRIFLLVAEELGDKQLVELATGQQAFYDVVEQSLAKGVEFDPNTDLAKVWKPEPASYPDVLMSPKFAFGHPVVARVHVPTSALVKNFRAEGNSFQAVSDWYRVPEESVRQAVEFEIEYAKESA